MSKVIDKTQPAGPANRGLKVIPKVAGFRRGGIAWPAEGRTVPLDQLSIEQVEQITAEPNLVCAEVDVEVEGAVAAQAASKKK